MIPEYQKYLMHLKFLSYLMMACHDLSLFGNHWPFYHFFILSLLTGIPLKDQGSLNVAICSPVFFLYILSEYKPPILAL
jgi:hypothetical protein